MNSYVLLGFIAGVFTSLSLLPQLYRVFKLRSAREISLTFTAALTFGNLLWLAYGILSGLVPIIFWNVVSFCLAGGLLVAKIRFGK